MSRGAAPRRHSDQGRARPPQAPFLPRTCLSPPRKQPGGHGEAVPSPAAGKRRQCSPGEPVWPAYSRLEPPASSPGPGIPRARRQHRRPARAAPLASDPTDTWLRAGRFRRGPAVRPPAPLPGTARHIPPSASPRSGGEAADKPRGGRSPRSEPPPPPPASRARCAEPGGSAGPAEEERGWRSERGAAADKASPRLPRSYL